MMRSLYSAITGLKNHQTSMDVIGNNISNVNTAGYKRQRTTFATMLAQEIRGAAAPTTSVGGINGVSVGLGSVLNSVDKLMSQGSSQYTAKATDMMIQGEGMFVLKGTDGTVYTRVGNFDFDKDGNLIDVGTGYKLQGYVNTIPDVSADPDYGVLTDPSNLKDIKFQIGSTDDTFSYDPDGAGPATAVDVTLSSFSIDKNGVITGVYTDKDGIYSVTREMFKIAIADFNNEGGLTPKGNNFYLESNNSGPAKLNGAGIGGRGTIIPSYLEMSNVDLAQEFTDMIVTQRGFQANSRIITVSDTLLQELVDLKR